MIGHLIAWLRRRRRAEMTVRADEVRIGDFMSSWHDPDGPRTPVVDVTIYPHDDGVDVVYLAVQHHAGSPCTTIRDAHDPVTIERRIPWSDVPRSPRSPGRSRSA